MRTAATDTGTAARALDPWNGAERAAAGASHARAHGWARAREGSGAAAALLPLPISSDGGAPVEVDHLDQTRRVTQLRRSRVNEVS